MPFRLPSPLHLHTRDMGQLVGWIAALVGQRFFCSRVESFLHRVI